MRKPLGLLALTVVLGAVHVSAHHSAVAFDQTKPIAIEGVITAVKWMNPHSWIYMDVTDADGKTVNWGLETVSPAQFASRVTPSLLKPGVRIIAKGPGPRDPSEHIMLFMEFELDGKSYSPGRAGAREGRGQ